MSTRARIGIENENGTVTSIYTHSDGYPGYNGRILAECYTAEADVRALLALGDLSILGRELGEDQGMDWFDRRWQEIGEARDTDPRYHWCLAYDRDRGESDVDAATHPADEWPESGAEYHYLYDRAGEWCVREVKYRSGPGEWRALADVLAEEVTA